MKQFILRALPAGLLALVLVGVAFAEDADATLVQADTALQAGQADQALGLLASLPHAGISDARAQNVLCRVQFTLAHWDAAVNACQQAVRLAGQESSYHMWLGRALGEKADNASFLIAFTLAKRTLVEFQAAVRLDPRNVQALSDLGEFYVEAPSIIGGGLDKAESVAEQLDRLDRPRAAELRAHIAEQRSNWNEAERQFKGALAISSHPAHEWASLTGFYRQRANWPEMEAAARNCALAVERDPRAAVALYDGSGALIRARRNPELAAMMLRGYVESKFKTEEAPAFVAYHRLAKLEQRMGDVEGAQRDRAAALALAHDYNPPQDAGN